MTFSGLLHLEGNRSEWDKAAINEAVQDTEVPGGERKGRELFGGEGERRGPCEYGPKFAGRRISGDITRRFECYFLDLPTNSFFLRHWAARSCKRGSPAIQKKQTRARVRARLLQGVQGRFLQNRREGGGRVCSS